MRGPNFVPLTAQTWPETFVQEGATVTIPNASGSCPASGPCVITDGGDEATGRYRIYDGWNGSSKNVINRAGAGVFADPFDADVGFDAAHGIVVKASYVIVRRVRVQGAAIAGIYIWPGVTNVVIEDSEIEDWSHQKGRTGDSEPTNPNSWGTWGWNEAGGVHLGGNNSRIVVQRNVIKAPYFGSFPWDTDRSSTAVPNNHPAGPMGISIQQAGNQNVFRYNEITGHPTDKNKWLQDGIGGGNNFSALGAPGADSDIYQNIIMNVFDDAIEAEGGNRNVRIWGNYASDVKTLVATVVTHYGPVYAWRNVVNRMRIRHQSITDTDLDFPMAAFKYGDGTEGGYGDGVRFLFHNTLLQAPGGTTPEGARIGVEKISNGSGSVRWTIARNNIFHISNPGYYSVESGDTPTGSHFAFNVYNGRYDGAITEQTPGETNPASIWKFSGSELSYEALHGWSSVPGLGSGAGAGIGNYWLGASSKGVDRGEVLPNFNDGFDGAAPDVGAHERNAPSMTFGITAQ
jgi:hypothetical protein